MIETPSLSSSQIIDNINAMIKQNWKNREDVLCDNVDHLVHTILVNKNLNVNRDPELSQSIHSLKSILTALSTTTDKVRKVTIETLNLLEEGKTISGTYLLEITKRLPAATAQDIQKSLQIFKTLQATHSEAQIALANWISYKQIPLSKLNFPFEELKLIAPHLTFLSLDVDLPEKDIQDFLLNCTKLGTLILESDSITKLSSTPPNLHQFVCRSQNIQEILGLNEGLLIFNCNNSDQLRTLPPSLPKSLEIFNCSECPNLQELPILNEKLKQLICFNCPKLELPYSLKKTSLEKLDCSQSSVQLLPVLPESLIDLICSECNNLTSIISSPQNLETMDVNRSENLESIDIPPHLKKLDMRRCQKLKLPEHLPPQLKVIR